MKRFLRPKKTAHDSQADSARTGEKGFSLLETAIALVIILVALLGVFFTITYAINYNAGNNSRAQVLAVLQQEVERLRSKKFTPAFTDTELLSPSTGPSTQTVVVNNLSFTVTTTIDNDPSTAAVDNESTVPSVSTSLKEITITGRLSNPSPGWQTAVPATVVLRRVKSN